MAKKKIVYTKKDTLDADEFDPKFRKVSISIRVDGDVLDAAKARAEALHVGYQTLMNDILKKALIVGSDKISPAISREQVDRILSQLEDVTDRVQELEKKRA
jgi:hypothetical protein